MSLAEVYDLSSALELDWYENIGLCKPGEAERMLNDGDTTIGGRMPVNPSGGLACFGEAVPAQAIAQVCELTWQLRGQAGERQVEGAKAGITANQGLFGHGSSVSRHEIAELTTTRRAIHSVGRFKMAEAYIIDAVRTPVGRKKGSLSHGALRPTSARTSVRDRRAQRYRPARVEDVVFGCVDTIGPQAGDIARTCWLAAGLPEEIPGTTIDRQCGSSQQAVHFAAQAVMSGTSDVVIAGGVQNMNQIPISVGDARGRGLRLQRSLLGFEGLGRPLRDAGGISQFNSAEMIAEKWDISREDMERLRAREPRPRSAGHSTRDASSARSCPSATFAVDEPPRESTLEKMASSEDARRRKGRLTAAVSSQISDASAALLIVSEEAVKRHGLTPRARIHHLSVRGADPCVDADRSDPRHRLRASKRPA